MFYFDQFSDGCHSFSDIILDPEGDPDSEFTPIVLLSRGNCSFVRKSKNVQELGGALALITDIHTQDPETVIMVDDGTGASIVIPTILISKEDGETIKKAVKDSEKNNEGTTRAKEYVVLIISFDIDNPDDRVEYDIWYTSGDYKALNFIRDMHSYHTKLENNVLMTPHMIVQTCSWCSSNEIEQNCIVSREVVYCAPPSNSPWVQGKEILRQGLQDICVYEVYKNSNSLKDREKWWNYMDNVHDCQLTRYSFDCIKAAMNKAGVDERKVQSCLSNEDNMLRDEHSLMQSSGIFYNPAVVINNKVYRGSLDPENVFRTICAGFNVTPSVCLNEQELLMRRGLSYTGIIWILVIIIVCTLIILWCYRRYERKELKEEMHLQISSMMTRYFSLNDAKAKPQEVI